MPNFLNQHSGWMVEFQTVVNKVTDESNKKYITNKVNDEIGNKVIGEIDNKHINNKVTNEIAK